MGLYSKIITFMNMDLKLKLLYFEAFALLAWARTRKIKAFIKVAPSLGKYMEETTFEIIESERQTIKNVADAIEHMSGYTFWESQCLVRAIAGMKMLERRKIDSTLYLGTAREKDGTLVAHAWLRSGPFYISGAEEMKRFTVVSMFAKRTDSEKGERHEGLNGT